MLDALSSTAATGMRTSSGHKHNGHLPSFLQKKIKFKRALADDTAPSFTYKTDSANKQNKEVSDSKLMIYQDQIEKWMQWESIQGVGAGLNNLGNTCFLNSVLQCLLYCAPFSQYLTSSIHKCNVAGFCIVCEMKELVVRVNGKKKFSSSSCSPSNIVAHLRLIAKHFRIGRQEDSHEFLRFLLDALHKRAMADDRQHKGTSLVHEIWQGRAESRVTCTSCAHESITPDIFLDLSLDIRGDSLERCLQTYLRAERLGSGNLYKCLSCKQSTPATKQLFITNPPPILTIHFKRFQMTPFGDHSKVNKHLEFSPNFSMANCEYSLFGVIVHEGHSCASGHYHAFVKAATGLWYSMNDSSVHQVSLGTVLKQRAYILFYAKISKNSPTCSSPSSPPHQTSSEHTKDSESKTLNQNRTEKKVDEEGVDKDLVVSNSMWHLNPSLLPNTGREHHPQQMHRKSKSRHRNKHKDGSPSSSKNNRKWKIKKLKRSKK